MGRRLPTQYAAPSLRNSRTTSRSISVSLTAFAIIYPSLAVAEAGTLIVYCRRYRLPTCLSLAAFETLEVLLTFPAQQGRRVAGLVLDLRLACVALLSFVMGS